MSENKWVGNGRYPSYRVLYCSILVCLALLVTIYLW